MSEGEGGGGVVNILASSEDEDVPCILSEK